MEQEPTTDVLLTELCRLIIAADTLHSDLHKLLLRASKAKQLRALREGMVALRETVERLHQRTTFLAPPSEHTLRKKAKLAAFYGAFSSSSPPCRRIYSLQELIVLTERSDDSGRVEIREALRDYGLKMTQIVRLCSTSRIRLLLELQAHGARSEYYTHGLTPALLVSLSRPFDLHELEASAERAPANRWPDVASDIKVDPYAAKSWSEAAKDYAGSDIVLTLHQHSDSCDIAKALYKKPTLEEIKTHKADEVKRVQEKFFETWPAARTYVEAYRLEEQRIIQQQAMPTFQDLKDLKTTLEGPRLRVKTTAVTSRLQKDTPDASSQGLGWCTKHHVGFRGYCADCHPDGDPTVKPRVCAYCGKAAQGNFAIHRDGFGEGPEVDLCDGCGDCDETVLSCETIWEKFAKDGVCR